ncbi:MAG TPA: acetyl-CoA C-acyltransferase [Gemmatimonadetes bacterium]|nr:acetyl-CoA C-acyltransferase [Gemmatimonadota bacterium]HBV06055.1 acetyl-CoA C-acyltransferase [Gemmatimonadota bacterium]HCO13145.1 acetyl-CoA C-acyltransferase [Gemmatimonadota bacterium]|tara:strand:+ start:6550 stop:7758 length:1209 start_codon:yes stop_codon:yes gene_type:complete
MATQGHSREVVVLSGKRTGFGTFGGSLKDFTATDLGVFSSRAAIETAGITPSQVDHTFLGNALQTSSDSIYLARHVALQSGVPEDRPALTVNRLCGSGFEAVVQGAKEIVLGEADVCLTGGTESMSQAPHVVRGARWGKALRLGPAGSNLEDLLWEALLDTNCDLTMAQTAEELADRYAVTREEADQVAVRSHQRAKAAWDNGYLDAEITEIVIKSRKGEKVYATDEHIRPDTNLESLRGLRPYFRKDGLVTAGNASGIGDGAASAVLASAEWAEANGVKPIGRIRSWGFVGVEPKVMGIGPAPAARMALEKAGLSLEDIDLVEVNEAFAPQYKAVEKELGLDPEKTNVNGGAIGLTHPLAASGARITIHLLHELRRRGGKFGLGSACIGGGQGGAVIVEAL